MIQNRRVRFTDAYFVIGSDSGRTCENDSYYSRLPLVGRGESSKAFALTWYRALIWYRVCWGLPRTYFEPWKAVGTRVRGSLAVW